MNIIKKSANLTSFNMIWYYLSFKNYFVLSFIHHAKYLIGVGIRRKIHWNIILEWNMFSQCSVHWLFYWYYDTIKVQNVLKTRQVTNTAMLQYSLSGGGCGFATRNTEEGPATLQRSSIIWFAKMTKVSRQTLHKC